MPGDIRDEQLALSIEADAVWLDEKRLGCDFAITGVTGFPAGARDGGNERGFRIHLAHAIVQSVNNKQTPLRVEFDAIRLVEHRLGCLPAIAAEALLAVARDRGDDTGFRIHLANA